MLEAKYNKYMKIAINLAKRGIGNTAPNPSVGCTIEKNGVIIGKGTTSFGGRPHAEINAIKSAISRGYESEIKNANLYVTLEPCSHYGQTPPCTKAIYEAGIKKVIIATMDPNPKVSGEGIKFLEDRGVDVVQDICKQKANEINAGFFKKIIDRRPYIILKLALTNDGKLSITKDANNSWFTNDIAKSYVHMLRYTNDAILVGANTLIEDNPHLTCRLNGLEEYSPKRFILSNNITEIDNKYNCYPAEILSGSINNIVNNLAVQKGRTRLLVEGGWKTSISFLDSGIVDEIHLITAENVKGHIYSPDIRRDLSIYLKKYNMTEQRNFDDSKLGTNTLVVYRHC